MQLEYFFQETCCPAQGLPEPFKRKWRQRAIQEAKEDHSIKRPETPATDPPRGGRSHRMNDKPLPYTDLRRTTRGRASDKHQGRRTQDAPDHLINVRSIRRPFPISPWSLEVHTWVDLRKRKLGLHDEVGFQGCLPLVQPIFCETRCATLLVPSVHQEGPVVHLTGTFHSAHPHSGLSHLCCDYVLHLFDKNFGHP
ncbi:hypothetical protein Pcinc_035090 [Petrolisthes cinctipes]|uniref:Uncharacterized protein n=1 Tax=Petrolisthes cinctipes TaxID=88211 RepID=A0AAE1EP15_PETCI|nr:hypothetical protein Pcinc_035090 [Petrolisthes cinctipes]